MFLVLIIGELFIGRARLHRFKATVNLNPSGALIYCDVFEQEDGSLRVTDHVSEIFHGWNQACCSGMIYASGGDSGLLRTSHFEEPNFTMKPY